METWRRKVSVEFYGRKDVAILEKIFAAEISPFD